MPCRSTQRALAQLYLALGHKKHAEDALLSALEAFEAIDHRLGIAVIKTAIGKFELKKGNIEEGRRLIEQALPAVRDIDKGYKFAEKKGMLETGGTHIAPGGQVQQDRIEDDPFWQANLHKINYQKAGEKNPGALNFAPIPLDMRAHVSALLCRF